MTPRPLSGHRGDATEQPDSGEWDWPSSAIQASELSRSDRLWGLDDPLFPATKVVVGRHLRFKAVGLERKHSSSAAPVRAIFKEAFSFAGLPYFNPHSFRKTLALLGGKQCRTPEEYKAWSQNLGHEHVLTTFCSYGDVSGPHGDVSGPRQTAIMRFFASAAADIVGDTVRSR